MAKLTFRELYGDELADSVVTLRDRTFASARRWGKTALMEREQLESVAQACLNGGHGEAMRDEAQALLHDSPRLADVDLGVLRQLLQTLEKHRRRTA